LKNERAKKQPLTLEEYEKWKAEFISNGGTCRQRTEGRLTMEIKMYGKVYNLIEVKGQRDGHPLPSFMGYKGYALRSVTNE